MKPTFTIRPTSEREQRKTGAGKFFFRFGFSMTWEEAVERLTNLKNRIFKK